METISGRRVCRNQAGGARSGISVRFRDGANVLKVGRFRRNRRGHSPKRRARRARPTSNGPPKAAALSWSRGSLTPVSIQTGQAIAGPSPVADSQKTQLPSSYAMSDKFPVDSILCMTILERKLRIKETVRRTVPHLKSKTITALTLILLGVAPRYERCFYL